MNAPVNNSQLKLLMAETLSFRAPVADRTPAVAPIGALRRALANMMAAFHRRAVVNELSTLTDRELSDIGLNRADLGRVFDPRFIRDRHYN